MALLDIVFYPDEPLTRKANPIEPGPETVELAENMIQTMIAFEGAGLAGPQVGLSRRIFVYRLPDAETHCLINPEVTDLRGREMGEEGCLSLPRLYAPVPRATSVHVKGWDATGRKREFDAEGFHARVIQHENDHLNGRVFPDRLDILSREGLLREWNAIREEIAGMTGG
jgi:peptide deformylase